MKTIVEPKGYVDKLWGKQRIKDDATYRIMRYVLRVYHDGKVLLHNVVTGHLVVLDEVEEKALEKLPRQYSFEMKQLVTERYLVPDDYDEHQQVANLRSILRKTMGVFHKTNLEHYVILPTTACNARCYYCYEQGIRRAYMSKQTANQVIDFICNHCGDKKRASITWFGGEPTLAIDRIEQICEGLSKKGVEYRSFMISNGYLFDEEILSKAKTLWNLQQITITIDGTESTYNQTKAFVNSCENPYERVMKNIGLMLDKNIAVKLRMNYDVDNWHEYEELVEEVKRRFSSNRLLDVSAHRILGEYPYADGSLHHGELAWFEEKKVELDAVTRNSGLHKNIETLPYMRYEACGAAKGTMIVITPEGNLVSCPDRLEVDQIKGNVKEGVTNQALVSEWKQFVEYERCAACPYMPYCVHMKCCNARDNCAGSKGLRASATLAIQQAYDIWMKKNTNGGVENGIQGTKS